MNRRESGKRVRRLKYLVFGVIGVVVVTLGVFTGVQAVTKTGWFRVPGEVVFDESIAGEERALISGLFEDVELDKNVYVSVTEVIEKPELSDGEFLWEILVPVGDFYEFSEGLVAGDATALRSEINRGGYELIDVSELDFRRRLIRVNGDYWLDGFNRGAIYRVIGFQSEKYDEEVRDVVTEVMTREFPNEDTVLTFAETGVTALSRRMNTKLAQVGDGAYFAEEIGEYLSGFDITHTSNEASFSNGANGENICSKPGFIDTLTAIGLDVVELTGNHNLDCGVSAAIETIGIYGENGIKTVGGGRNAEEAAVPLNLSQKGTNITMLAFNESTGGATTGDYPGANQYYEDVSRRQISEAKARGDFVIVNVQYYECNDYDHESEWTTCDAADSAAGDQVGLFRELIDMGADVVVGTSAHQAQTFELYGDGAIYYGLGNLFFDQSWWPGTTRSLVLVHHFYKGQLLQTEIVPTVYDASYQTKLMDEETARWFVNRLASARP